MIEIVWVEGIVCVHGEGIEVIAEDLGAEVLLRGKPGQAGKVFEFQAMLETFESLLDAPTGMVEIGKIGGRIGAGIEQRGHQDMYPAIRRNNPQQANRVGLATAAVVFGVALRGRADGHQRLVATGTEEASNAPEAGLVDTHAERNAPCNQNGDQPTASESRDPAAASHWSSNIRGAQTTSVVLRPLASTVRSSGKARNRTNTMRTQSPRGPCEPRHL